MLRTNTYNCINQFREAIQNSGLTPPTEIISNGEFYRFSTNNKPNDKSGWYILYNNPIPAGAFGDWRTGAKHTWSATSQGKITAEERIKLSKQIETAKMLREKDDEKKYQQAAKQAVELWNEAKPASQNHSYLLKKQIHPFITRQIKETLILPITDYLNQILSLQFIESDGSKKLLSRGRKKGGFIMINDSPPNSNLLICEGFATGATLAQAYPDVCVISAIDAGNLEPVAVIARKHWPKRKIICADDDQLTSGNPGVTKGRKAAVAASALLSIPQWPSNSPKSLSDFNDLSCWLISNTGRLA